VSVDNRAVNGEDTAGLISQLQSPDVASAVRRADVILVTIGANDFGDHHDQVVSGRCESGDSDCVSDELGTMRANLTSVLARIRALRQGTPSTVLVTGYWNVFEDGDVARRAFGASGLQASLQLTRRANAAIQSVATSAGARYVDLLAPFQQAGQNITTLLASDGDHPDAAGHQLIARALLAAGLPRSS
jgi:lysophospholipase L1-like esterase